MNYKYALAIIVVTLNIIIYPGEPITIKYNHENWPALAEKYLKIISTIKSNYISYNITLKDHRRSITVTKTIFDDGRVKFDGHEDGNGREIGPVDLYDRAQTVFEEITEIIKPK